MSTPPVIHWFRRDLRLTDNTALDAAAETGAQIVPVFIFDPAITESPHLGLPRFGFLLKALEALDKSLQERGSRLVIRRGDPRQVLRELTEEFGAAAVYANRDISPFAYKRDAEIEQNLGVPLHWYDDVLMLPPGLVLKDDGKPYTVFTPFKKKWLTIPKAELVSTPGRGAFQKIDDAADIPTLADFGKTLTMDLPEASEAEAQKRLHDFLAARVYEYSEGRNVLAAVPKDDTEYGSSFLSPYLRLGMLSPRQAYWGAREAYKRLTTETPRKSGEISVEAWVSELVWRDFYGHILHHFPHVLKSNFRPAYDALEWRKAPQELQAWKDGMTGYPVVDAAMRQLKTMGWMPNRARMIVASFLTKDLLISWQEGEQHFMDWLIDGDPAANNGGWQWSAGTGTDAQPYFRIFQPVSQSEKFDPDGEYIRRWIPELRGVDAKFIHAPWEMETPPADYPPPIVDHKMARERTLAAFKAVKDGG